MTKSTPTQAAIEDASKRAFRREDGVARFIKRMRRQHRVLVIDKSFAIALAIIAPIMCVGALFSNAFVLWLLAMQPILVAVIIAGFILRS